MDDADPQPAPPVTENSPPALPMSKPSWGCSMAEKYEALAREVQADDPPKSR
jgi:hypothetical protein